MKDKLKSVKNHIHHHRAKYAATATFAVTMYASATLMIRAGEQWREFATEHGVLDAWEAHLDNVTVS